MYVALNLSANIVPNSNHCKTRIAGTFNGFDILEIKFKYGVFLTFKCGQKYKTFRNKKMIFD